MALKLQHPSTLLVAGPTMSGKTCFVVRFLQYEMLDPPPNRIIWVYSSWQKAYDQLKEVVKVNIEFKQQLPPDLYEELQPEDNNLVVLDDQMEAVRDNMKLSKLFTTGCHHRNASIIYIVQNLYDKGKAMRSVSLNSHYMFLFKNPRDTAQVQQLAIQIEGRKWRYVVDAYKEETSRPYGYLMLDLRPETPEDYRVRGRILPDDGPPVVYVSRD